MIKTEFEIGDRPTSRRILRTVWIAMKWMLGLLVITVIAVSIWIWHEERESLIRSYEVPTFYLNMLSLIEGRHPVRALMNDDESIMCVLQQSTLGNLNVSSIDALSIAQMDAVRGVVLPSPDSDGHYWYILFFKGKAISRIYLAYDHQLDFDLANAASSCADRSILFTVWKRHFQDRTNNLLIKFHNGD